MHKIWKLLTGLIVSLCVAYYGLVTYIVPDYIKQMLPAAEKIAEDYINGSVKIGSVVWDGGLTAEITDVTVYDTETRKVAVIPETKVSLRPWLAVIDPAKAIGRLELQRPEVWLAMNENAEWNLQYFLKPSESDQTPFYGLMEITEGTLHVSAPYGSWDFIVNGSADGGANPDFSVQAVISDGKNIVEADGILTTKGTGTLDLHSENLLLDDYASAAFYYAGAEDVHGNIRDLHLRWSSANEEVDISGKGIIENLTGSYTYEGEKHNFTVDGGVKIAKSVAAAKDLVVSVDDQKLYLDGKTDFSDINDISGEIKVYAPELHWKEWQAKNIRLELAADESLISIKQAEAEYGGGTVKVKGRYDVQDNFLIADAQLAGITQKVGLLNDENICLSGDVAVMADLADDKMQIHAAADTFDLSWRSLRINKITFDGSLQDDVLTVEHLGALADKGSLAAGGKIDLNSRAVHLSARMAEFPVGSLLDYAGYSGSGYCSTGFDITGTIDAPEFAGIVQLTDVSFMHQSIKEAHGNIAMKDNILSIADFKANMEQGSHLVNGSVDFSGSEPVFDMAVETMGVRAEPIMAVAYPDIKVTGNVDNIIHLQGTLNKAIVTGEVCLTDGSAEGYLLDKVQGRYVFNDGFLRLKDFVIHTLATEITLDGTMDRMQNLDFSMDAKNFMLDRIPLMEKDFDIDGYMDARGYLRGTLSKPYFLGDISSRQISINGQILSDLEGYMESNGSDINKFDISCKQPYDDDSGNYGLFKAELNINIPQRFAQGDIVTLWGDLGNILKMCKVDYNIDGTVQGEININSQGKGSGININIWADDVKIHDLNYHQMLFDGTLKNGILSFDNVKIMEQKDVTDKGLITLNGQVDIRNRSVDAELKAVKANPAIATVMMYDPPVIKGEADMLIKVNGPFDNLSAKCDLQVNQGSLAGVSMDKLITRMSMLNDNINLEEFIASKGVYRLNASGDIPVDLFREKSQRKNPDAQMRISMNFDESRLGILPAFSDMIEWADGETKGQLIIGGTLEDVWLDGSLKIEGGSIKAKYLDTMIDGIQADVQFQGKEIALNNLSAKLGKGNVTASGTLNLQADESSAYKLNIVAQDAELASEIFTGRINSNIDIVPQKYYDFKSRPPALMYRPQIKGFLRLDDVLVNMPTIPEFGEGQSNLGMDMKIELGPDIHLFNKYLYDIWLEGSMNIKGSTVFPVIDGNIKSRSGTVTYLRTPFKIERASVGWPVSGTFLPTVSLDSSARFSRYDIFMRVNGPLEEMELQLTSNPPLTQNTIIRMLTLQRDGGGADDVTGEDLQNLMTAGLQMTVLGDVEMLVKQTIGLDQFRIYTGRVRSGIGFEGVKDKNQELTPEERSQYNILVSKYLTKNFMLGYTTSFDGVDRSIFGQYDISRHFNLTYSRSYDLSDEAEEWYGVEYRLSF